MTDKLSIEKDAIRSLADILVETDLTEIEYENDGHRIRVARNLTVTANYAAAAPVLPAAAPIQPAGDSHSSVKAPNESAIKSPMVGMVYVSGEPGTPPFVKVGDMVAQGQTLLIIEAMKVMNPIKSPRSGKVTNIYISDAQPVEFGEPLLSID